MQKSTFLTIFRVFGGVFEVVEGCFGGYFRVFMAIWQYKGSTYSKHMVYCSMYRVYTSGKIGDFSLFWSILGSSRGVLGYFRVYLGSGT